MFLKISPGGIIFDIPFEGKLNCSKHEFNLHGCKSCDLLKKANYQLANARDIIEKWSQQLSKAIEDGTIKLTIIKGEK